MHLVVVVCGSGMEASSPLSQQCDFLETGLSAVSRMRLPGRAASLFPPLYSFPSPRFQCRKVTLFSPFIHSFIHSSPLYKSTFDFNPYCCAGLPFSSPEASRLLLHDFAKLGIWEFLIPHSLSLIAPLPPPSFPFPPFLSASRCLSRSALIGSCMM